MFGFDSVASISYNSSSYQIKQGAFICICSPPLPNATTCPLRLRGLPPRLWLKCNRPLKLGRPVGAVTLSRWEWWWNERWIWGARGGLKPNFYQLPRPWSPWDAHGDHGLGSLGLPLSRKNAHGRAGNRTRDLMVSSQELWPASHEAGLICICKVKKICACPCVCGLLR